MSKRTLSESSTGSEGDIETPHATNGAPYFKIPRQDSSGPLSPTYRGQNSRYYNQDNSNLDTPRPIGTGSSQGLKHERRESQASTTSTVTSRSSLSETDDDYADGQKLSTALESDSSSSDESNCIGTTTYKDNMPSHENDYNQSRDSSSNIQSAQNSLQRPYGVSENNFLEERMSNEAASKKMKTESGSSKNYSTFAQKMMSKMGYKEGTGLGKQSQGIVEPIEASQQRGRRGLGLIIAGLTGDGPVPWDADKEHIEIEEKVSWIDECTLPCPELKELRNWMKEGRRKSTIDDETTFCDPEILANILKCKSVFDSLEPEELRKARTKSNPFETIRGVFFLNRAAMKMANMDAVFDFMFTEPKNSEGRGLVNKDELFYFADVCAGPGGFSEYILWRKQWRSKGFGFTLKGKNDFKLEDFFAGPPESFETHYGLNGIDGDGDVFKEENFKAFKQHVLDNTNGLGVHVMMADGGFTVEGQENIQEILSKQLYLCQFLFALHVVRTGGNFVCKLFDIFTPFSVGLIYLMYRAFERICIHKPNTSRPANSERYIICKGKRQDCKPIADYLFEVNCRLNEIGFSPLGGTESLIDVNHIVPQEVILQDHAFFNYINHSNNTFGEWQIMGLAKIVAFAKDIGLLELRQSEIKDQCLHFWKIPNKTRKAPTNETPHEKVTKLLNNKLDFLHSSPTEITNKNLKECFKTGIHDWKCIILGSNAHSQSSSIYHDTQERAGFFLGLGRSKVYHFSRNKWEKLGDDMQFDLSRGTLLYGEIVKEMRGEARSQRKVTALHIIDAIFLGGDDLRQVDFIRRNELCKIFAKAMNKSSMPGYIAIRCKEIFSLQNIEDQIIGNLKPRLLKSSGGRLRITYDVGSSETNINRSNNQNMSYFCPTGVLYQRIVKEPWMIAKSRSTQRKYWYNAVNRQSLFDCPQEALIDFVSSYSKRLIWTWDQGVKIIKDQDIPIDDSKLQANQMIQFIEQRL